jgi:hypothetical protein
MQKDEKGYYIPFAASEKFYIFFEGQIVPKVEYFANLIIAPTRTERLGLDVIFHAGFFRFYTYAPQMVVLDHLTDKLSELLNEKTIDIDNFKIELDLINPYQRGNKFKGWESYENINDIKFRHWSHV